MELGELATDPLRLVAWLGASVLLGVLLLQPKLAAWKRRRQARARADRARKGEQRAERLLRYRGFRVIDRQVRQSWRIGVDGQGHEVGLRADLLVARGGRRWVAEVKTGRDAPRIEQPSTRRQLLEYRMVFDVDGVLLVDPEAGRIREVTFWAPARCAHWRHVALGWLAGAVVGATAIAWLAS